MYKLAGIRRLSPLILLPFFLKANTGPDVDDDAKKADTGDQAAVETGVDTTLPDTGDQAAVETGDDTTLPDDDDANRPEPEKRKPSKVLLKSFEVLYYNNFYVCIN